MEREIILLPSLLLASGFECLNTQDIKFLNNYRKHFDKTRHNLEEIFIVTESDYELGGIMNPFNQMAIDHEIYEQVRKGIQTFPYVTRIDLNKIVYSKQVKEIIKSLTKEIVTDFKSDIEINEGIQMAVRNSTFCNQSIELIKSLPIYAKISAFHLCGQGLKLIDAFNHFLTLYLKKKRNRKL